MKGVVEFKHIGCGKMIRCPVSDYILWWGKIKRRCQCGAELDLQLEQTGPGVCIVTAVDKTNGIYGMHYGRLYERGQEPPLGERPPTGPVPLDKPVQVSMFDFMK